jgi:hypothetical protein
MNEGVIFGLAGMAFTLILVVPLIWQGFKTWQVRIASRETIARDEAYRHLAQEAVSAQQTAIETQRQMAQDLSEVRERVIAIEKMLREVD